MRWALWLVGLFAVAVAGALFAGSNRAMVTLFWSPYRVDLSLNLVVLLLFIAFFVLHYALRALAALLNVPQQARSWRMLHKERAVYSALTEGWLHLAAGRYVRARKAAESVVSIDAALRRDAESLPQADTLRTSAHLLGAESAHALQDHATCDVHFQSALSFSSGVATQEAREGVLLRAAQWSLHRGDAAQALHWLDQLPSGAARRTVALRLRFRAARLAGRPQEALDTVRLLSKHHAMSAVAGQTVAQALILEMLRAAHDVEQLQQVWQHLDAPEQVLPEVALSAAARWLDVDGKPEMARTMLLPVWQRLLENSDSLGLTQRVRCIRLLERSFTRDPVPDTAWLERVEAAQLQQPGNPLLLYLAGIWCMRLGLWGKAQQLLLQAQRTLTDTALKRDAWYALGTLAEQRSDTAAAEDAYRQALMHAKKME
jgi:HemY protein